MLATTTRYPAIPPRPTFWLDPVCVYRFYDKQGVLLYVGITGSPSIRFGAHRAGSTWWAQADLSRTLISWRETKGHAEAEEVAAVIVERPIFNIVHKPGPRVTNRQAPVPGLTLGEFRKQLSERVDAAYSAGECTVVKHGSRNIARAVLVPFEVGPDPIPVTIDGQDQAYVVSPEWFARAQAAMGQVRHDPASGT